LENHQRAVSNEKLRYSLTTHNQISFKGDILDCVSLAQYIMASCFHHHQPEIFLKLDIRKAFNYIDRLFLLSRLRAPGFGAR